ncbi:D-amino acid aminotransferase [Campylobacter corcagiensis]|uniref:branched-chain-amino-acid transaminase n=1 Tax=Campylobacter corcagiensis TaxID=1448857 RepID=A0A7M1LH22_9BACT|nr:D-amino acid aminotransferase [Campylobacter corcagiensis]QKF65054.1 D-amino acid aminotransferase [Campylobacter corcagiensis]QOQ86795.1 D-amino acid aminotransferase [Campylobacter corcagiensis]
MINELTGITYVNGEFVEAKEAKISAYDRGFIFGDGVYEVVPFLNAKLVDNDDFWQRFQSSLAKVEIKCPFSRDEFESIAYKLIEKNGIKSGGLYIEITRGAAPRDFHFITGLTPTVVAFVYEKNILENPKATTGLEVITFEDIRWKRRDIKSVSLLGQCIAKEAVHKAGVDECIMYENGFVTEASSSSVFIIKDKVLITKPLSNEILPGIRRKNILKFAHEAGLKTEERNFTLDELFNADEVFISAATLMLLPVVKVDQKLISGGKVGEFAPKLRELYAKKIKKEAGLI